MSEININIEKIVFEELTDQEFSNILAERKSQKPIEVKSVELSDAEKTLIASLKTLSNERMQVVSNEVNRIYLARFPPRVFELSTSETEKTLIASLKTLSKDRMQVVLNEVNRI